MALNEIRTHAAPAPIGPYSQAVAWERLVFCSGQVALDPESGEMLGGGEVVAEAEQVLKNLGAVLEAAGCRYLSSSVESRTSRAEICAR